MCRSLAPLAGQSLRRVVLLSGGGDLLDVVVYADQARWCRGNAYASEGLEYVGGDIRGGVILGIVVHNLAYPLSVVVDDLPFAIFEAVPAWATLSDVTLLASKRRKRLVRSANRFALG